MPEETIELKVVRPGEVEGEEERLWLSFMLFSTMWFSLTLWLHYLAKNKNFKSEVEARI